MKNLSMLSPFFFFFFLLLCHISVATTARYIAVDDIALNCGFSGNSTARDKREWIGDIDSGFAPIEEPNRKSSASTAEQQGYIDAVPYQTARISSFQFTYEFRVTPGPKFVRLHFYAASYRGFSKSTDFFTVKAGSFTLLRNFSASFAKSSYGGMVSKEFCVNVGEGKTLNVTFIPFPSVSSKFYAFINGIEIVSMPKDLYYGPEVPGLPYVGQLSPFVVDYDMALEKVVRLNIGGGAIAPVEDTGMFREWSPDIEYNFGGGVIPHHPDLKPIFSKIPNYTAPDDVYRTAVSMGPNSTRNLVSNLTWRLPVDSGFDYLVRLHFCEIEPEITKAGERPFIIYIDNKTAQAWADVLLWSGRNETPVYKDYVVRIQNKAYLFVALHPIIPSYGIIDAILNGMEVFKLSNTQGNLAVAGLRPDNLAPPTLAANESETKKTKVTPTGNGLRFFLVLTLVCCAVLWKLRSIKQYVSPYPFSKIGAEPNLQRNVKSDKSLVTARTDWDKTEPRRRYRYPEVLSFTFLAVPALIVITVDAFSRR